MLERYGLEAMAVDADEESFDAQEATAFMNFPDAMDRTLNCLLANPGGDPGQEGVPWDYVTTVPENYDLDADANDDAVGAAVRRILNRPDATLYLLGPDDYAEDNPRKAFSLENGETTDSKQVFFRGCLVKIYRSENFARSEISRLPRRGEPQGRGEQNDRK